MIDFVRNIRRTFGSRASKYFDDRASDLGLAIKSIDRHLILAVTAAFALVIPTAVLAQPLSTKTAAGIAEATTAFHYADLAYEADDIVFAQSSLQKVINCLLGPGDAGFSAAAGNPCAEKGHGAIRDMNRTFAGQELQLAVGEASFGLKRVELKDVRSDALSAMDYLGSVRESWLFPALNVSAAPLRVVKLGQNQIELSQLKGAMVKRSGGSAIGTITDMLLDRERHFVSLIALEPTSDTKGAVAVRWSALKLMPMGTQSAGSAFLRGPDTIAAAPQFGAEVNSQPSNLDVERNLLGRPVVAADGQTIGKLVDLVVERQSGIVDYVLVSGNKAIGAAKSARALPWKAVANLMIEHAVVLALDEKQLAAAPIFISK